MGKTKVILGKFKPVRFSYANVFTPVAVNDGDAKKYSVSLLIPKSDKKGVKEIKDAIQAAAEQGKDKPFGGKIPKNYKNPLRDGDEDREDSEEYEGHYFINANTTRKPQVVDEDLDPILVEDEFYSGCYGRASINFYAYSASGNKGVAAGLNNLQKLEDGDRLGGSVSSAQDDFGDDDLM